MRGLKHGICRTGHTNQNVASFTDAWIETLLLYRLRMRRQSHLLQMRGLKLNFTVLNINIKKSHLLQMRGLKLLISVLERMKFWSHLLQMRGLKPLRTLWKDYMDFVASFTDAWIETNEGAQVKSFQESRIFYRCVD